MATKSPEPLPFWKEELEKYEDSRSWELTRKLFVFYGYFLIFVLGIVLFIVLMYILKPVIAIVYIGLVCLLVFYSFRRRRQALTGLAQVKQIQAHAKEITGAEVIGSAVHVAGHPTLEREQPVVLALKGERLSIYSYQSQNALDEIPVGAILATRTVVYDEDRIPHIEVIDNTAQALQIEYQAQGDVWTCLFRRMKKARPIDWHHAIQRARYRSGIKA